MNENTTPDNADDTSALLVLEPVEDHNSGAQDSHEDLDDEHDGNDRDTPDTVHAEPAPEVELDTQRPAEQTSPLDRVLTIQGFVDTPSGRRFFPTTDSLRWFLRTNRRELIEAGALIKMGKRTMVCRPQIDQEVIRIARLAAQRDLAS